MLMLEISFICIQTNETNLCFVLFSYSPSRSTVLDEKCLAGAKNGNLGGLLSLYESQSYVIRENLNPSKVDEEK